MNRNPEVRLSKGPGLRHLLLRCATYVGAYLVGIMTSIALTPAEVFLAGRWLGDDYPWFSLIGFFFFYFGYYDLAWDFWSIGWTALGVMAFGVASFFGNRPRLVALRPWLLAFPVGFVGTLGAYYAAAGSI